MKYSDYQTIVEKEYEKNRKNIFTCYFFILLSVNSVAVFFLSVRELPVAGAAFLLDFAAAVYALRAFKGLHPYWEMQYAPKSKGGSDGDERGLLYRSRWSLPGKSVFLIFMAEHRKFLPRNYWHCKKSRKVSGRSEH